MSGSGDRRFDAAVVGGAVAGKIGDVLLVVAGMGILARPGGDDVLGCAGRADGVDVRASVAGREEDQEVLVVPHELVDILGIGGVGAFDRGAPGIGMDPRAGVVGLLEIGVEVAGYACQGTAVADILNDELGVVGNAVIGGIGGERFAGDGACHMGSVIMPVPVAVSCQVIVGDDLALIVVDGGSGYALAAVPEENHIGVEAGVADADDLAGACQALVPERSCADGVVLDDPFHRIVVYRRRHKGLDPLNLLSLSQPRQGRVKPGQRNFEQDSAFSPVARFDHRHPVDSFRHLEEMGQHAAFEGLHHEQHGTFRGCDRLVLECLSFRRDGRGRIFAGRCRIAWGFADSNLVSAAPRPPGFFEDFRFF